LRKVSTEPIPGLIPNRNGVKVLNFDDKAQAIFNSWYADNEKMLRQGKLDPSEQSHFAKYRSLIPGLALLFHLLDHNGPQVGVESISLAIKFSYYLKSHARRIYGSVHGLDATSARSLATNLIKAKLSDGFTQRTVMHKGWKSLQTKYQVEMAVNTLVEYGWLTEHASENAGRKTVVYRINPKICNELL
jgi:putative DNA primase/helicase